MMTSEFVRVSALDEATGTDLSAINWIEYNPAMTPTMTTAARRTDTIVFTELSPVVLV
jgi:hypothetical protein